MKSFSDVGARLRYMTNEVYMNGKSPWSVMDYIKQDEFDNASLCHPLLLLKIDCLRWEATRMVMMDSGNAKARITVVITGDLRKGDDKEHGVEPHYVGVDIRVQSSAARYYLLKAAFAVGFQRIGIYCDDKHLHLGIGDQVETEKTFPSFVCWVRECKS